MIPKRKSRNSKAPKPPVPKVGEREKGHKWAPILCVQHCSCGWLCVKPDPYRDCHEAWQAHLASLEAQPERDTPFNFSDAAKNLRDLNTVGEALFGAAHPSAGQSDSLAALVERVKHESRVVWKDGIDIEVCWDTCIRCDLERWLKSAGQSELPPEVIAEIERGREDMLAGHTVPIEQVRAGQSDASLSQLLNAVIEAGCTCDVMYGYTCSIHSKVYAIAEFVRTRLAESRAAMREEAAKVLEEMKIAGDGPGDPCYEGYESALIDAQQTIKALPADSSALDAERDASEDMFCKILTGELPAMAANDCDRVASALDARDARVRLEEQEKHGCHGHKCMSIVVMSGKCDCGYSDRIAQLQRSAEKGKGE